MDMPVQSLGSFIDGIYRFSVEIVGLAVFGMFIYAGFKFMFGKNSEGWSIIQDALIGALLLFSAVVILKSISPDLVEQTGKPIPSLKESN